MEWNYVRVEFLGDLAPTILDLLGVQQPEEMTGKSLIKIIHILRREKYAIYC